MIILKDKTEELKKLYKIYGGTWEAFNIFGIRNAEDAEKSIWNDVCGFAYLDKIYLMKGTVDPSRFWTKNHRKGVDHLVAMFHKDLWKFGTHRGSDAFVQGDNYVNTWRDKNRNYKLDEGDELVNKRRWHGINFHTSYKRDLSVIGKSSAGCVVAKFWAEFEKTLAIAIASGQTSFSFLLMELKLDNKFLYEACYEQSKNNS